MLQATTQAIRSSYTDRSSWRAITLAGGSLCKVPTAEVHFELEAAAIEASLLPFSARAPRKLLSMCLKLRAEVRTGRVNPKTKLYEQQGRC